MAKRKSKTKTAKRLTAAKAGTLRDPALLSDVRQLIAAAREQTARVVNTTLVIMYPNVAKTPVRQAAASRVSMICNTRRLRLLPAQNVSVSWPAGRDSRPAR